MEIARESPDQPEVVQLIRDLDDYQRPLYPPESYHGVDLATLLQPNVIFVVARDATRTAVGCGGVMLMPDYGELKRMYVRPADRGRGIAQAMLALVEEEARRAGCTLLMLETGTLQLEALTFYERAGYTRRPPFGEYWDDPHSVFMEKRLS
ncbi:MAG TPA: GNAT family N-acetyltransferase [Burkholderiaceae bacterium]|nr:GNAT family N-acetyltransferase [Burkholderiaceae bacterium]